MINKKLCYHCSSLDEGRVKKILHVLVHQAIAANLKAMLKFVFNLGVRF